jgi:predicted unusual protein kinase regulating ubiquinone biosynthesis (AarF/ABC1/UbiB family)
VRQEVCNVGIDAFCQMLFVHNFVHGDLHPGNVFIVTRPDRSPKLAFLDAGIVVRQTGGGARGGGRSARLQRAGCGWVEG